MNFKPVQTISNDTFYLEKTKNNFAEILNKYNYKFNNNDIVAGTIIGIETDGVLVDIGATFAAYLPLSEISLTSINHPNEILNIGEIREFLILNSDLPNKKIIISIQKLAYIKAWEKIKQLLELPK